MDREKTFNQLLQCFMRIINKQQCLEDAPKSFGTDFLLYKSEIHAIEVIGNNPDSNMTEIADHLGITKGALSQVVSKLRKKGLVQKVKREDNEKEVFLQLTPSGKTAHQQHREFHNQNFKDLFSFFSEMSEDQVHFIEFVFNKIEGHIDQFIINNNGKC